MANLRSENGAFKAGGICHSGSRLRVAIALLAVLLLVSNPMFLLLDIPSAQAEGTILSDDDGLTSNVPQIAVSGSNVHVVWQDSSVSGGDIFIRSSANDGATFSDIMNVSKTAQSSSSPQIAVSGSNVHVVWQDNTPGNNDIFVASSSDNGQTFPTVVNVSDNADSSTLPQIAVSGSNVHVVWQESVNNDIFVASSSDSGENFSEPVNLSNNAGVSSLAQVAASGSNVHVVWRDATPNDIFYTSSANAGANYTTPINVSNNAGVSSSPQLTASGSDVYIVWQDSTLGNNEIMYVSSPDGGATMTDTWNLSNNTDSSTLPQIAVSGSNVHVVWVDGSTGVTDILSRSSSNGGSNFSASFNVSDNAAASTAAQVTVSSGGDVYVVWSDKEVGPSQEIFLSISNDGGITFDNPVNLSTNSGDSTVPQIALAGDGTNAHVVWQDTSSGVAEVMVQSDLNPEGPSIALDPISNTDPKWGDFDPEETEVVASGSLGNAEPDDKVIVEWGDGSSDQAEIDGSSWGPVSHNYTDSAIGNNTVVARLLASGDTEKAVSNSVLITVHSHASVLELNQIPSVSEGTEVTAEGTLTDGETGDPIEDMSVSFTGSGAVNLAPDDTDELGVFSSPGLAVNGTGLTVQAHFNGTLSYDPASSEAVSYDAVDPSTDGFPITHGSDVHVSLTGFDASMDFTEVATDGTLFVSECVAPISERYEALEGGCLEISPGFVIGDGPVTLNMSFANATIPDGFAATDVALFHEDAGSIVDITLEQGTASQTIAGQVSSFSKFILGAVDNGEPAPGDHWTQIYVGDGNEVSLRDINNANDASVTAAFSQITSSGAKLTVTDLESNAEPGRLDIVEARVESNSSSPNKVILTLNENAVNSGVFEDTFSFSSDSTSELGGPLKVTSGDKLSPFYIPGARFKAVIDGVTESDSVVLSDLIMGTECREVGDQIFDQQIGGGVELRLLNSEFGPGVTISANISYANANLEGADVDEIRMFHKANEVGSSWTDITLPLGAHNPDAKTVAGEADSEGFFSLGVLHDSCVGGAGGGFGRGLIVDAVASVASSGGSTGGSSGGSSGGGGGGGGGSSSVPRVSSPSAATSVLPGDAVSTFAIVPAASGFLGGQITLNFEHVILPGSISIREEVPASGIFDSVTAGQGSITSTDGAGFMTAGPIFDIVPSTSLQFDGTVEVAIPYSEALARAALGGTFNAEQLANAEANVRFMHFNGTDWEDLTTSINPVSNTVTGKVSSFSRVVAAVVDDGTFSSGYFVDNPTSRMAIKSQDGSLGIAFVDAQGTAVTAVKRGTDVSVVTTVKNLQRTSQEYLYIVETFNSRGIVVDIDMLTGTLDQAQEVTMDEGSLRGGSEKSAYTVKVFLLDESLNGSIFLAPVAEAQIPVIS